MKNTQFNLDALKSIVECIEEETSPAMRVIADFAILLLPTTAECEEAEKFVNDLFKEYDAKKEAKR